VNEDEMDDEFMGERRRGLEEAYFAKHNRALLERFRAGNTAATDSVKARATDDFDEGGSCAAQDTPGNVSGAAAAGRR
jgi:hypothetical protein